MGFVRKDGEERQHWMSLNRVIDDRGEAIGYVSTSEDITERLRAEARLVEALETERQAVEQLREVDRVKDAFVSSVSHELRTPITSILGYTELLEEGAARRAVRRPGRRVDRISRNSNRLLTLISELLTLSKVQAGTAVAGRPGGRPDPGRRRRARGALPHRGPPRRRAHRRPALVARSRSPATATCSSGWSSTSPTTP